MTWTIRRQNDCYLSVSTPTCSQSLQQSLCQGGLGYPIPTLNGSATSCGGLTLTPCRQSSNSPCATSLLWVSKFVIGWMQQPLLFSYRAWLAPFGHTPQFLRCLLLLSASVELAAWHCTSSSEKTSRLQLSDQGHALSTWAAGKVQQSRDHRCHSKPHHKLCQKREQVFLPFRGCTVRGASWRGGNCMQLAQYVSGFPHTFSNLRFTRSRLCSKL